jgi:hypothetical protein
MIDSLVIYFGGNEIVNGWTTFDNMLKAFMAILFAAMGMAQASVGFGDVGKAKSAVLRIFTIVDREPLIDSSEGSREDPYSPLDEDKAMGDLNKAGKKADMDLIEATSKSVVGSVSQWTHKAIDLP